MNRQSRMYGRCLSPAALQVLMLLPAPRLGHLEREPIYDALTATKWGVSQTYRGMPMMNRSETLVLDPDGRFSWVEDDGDQQSRRNGPWNFELLEPRAGLLYLSKDSVYRFKLEGDSILM